MKDARRPVELGLLLALCFFLPLLEAPKNILWAAYGLTWLVNRARARDWGRWDGWDTLIATWIGSGFLVAAFAGLPGEEWRGASDLLRYGSVLWMVKRAGYDQRQQRWIVGTLVAATVVGLADGYARIWSGRSRDGTLELHSVGHVNHTAIYLAIMFGVCAAWIFTRWRAWRAGTRTVAVAVATLFLVSIVITASRGAIGIALAMLPLLAAMWWPRSRVPMAVSAAVVALVALAIVVGGAEVMRRQRQYLDTENVLSFRDGIWRAAMAAWQRYPWFGVGMDNYSRITAERLRAWDADAGKVHDSKRYFPISHGHSLYFNTLAERGVVGSISLAAVLVAWGVALIRRRPGPGDPDDDWLAWGCAAAAWIVTVAVGTVNTTLHDEHGLLAVLLLGLWLSRLEPGEPQPARAFAGERNH